VVCLLLLAARVPGMLRLRLRLRLAADERARVPAQRCHWLLRCSISSHSSVSHVGTPAAAMSRARWAAAAHLCGVAGPLLLLLAICSLLLLRLALLLRVAGCVWCGCGVDTTGQHCIEQARTL
jgi:hypothetical protein